MPSYSASSGLLAEAARQAVKAGGTATLPRTPATVRTVTLAGIRRPYDVLPSQGDKYPVRLHCEAHHASAVALTLSYRTGIAGETTTGEPLAGSDVPRPRPLPPRQHAAVITFGTGGAQHVLECDVTEGTVVTLPTQVLEVAFVHYGTRALDPLPPVDLQSQASAAYGSAVSLRAVKTQRALMPLGFDFELDVDDAFSGDVQSTPRLRDAQSPADVEDAFLGALAAAHDGSTLRGAYTNALRRLDALLPVDPSAGEGG